ncbi:M23 family metallopeptidase [Nocardioides sp. MAHUQ-72]|uniref:M23 family metallopeptidase n=1 Tax=unclassified Nocardioides TaxID=2615069 RepID=UPI00360F1199
MGNHRADRRGPNRAVSETPIAVSSTGGKRRAEKPARRHTASRGQLFRGLPSTPVLLGVAALAVSAGGAVTAANPGLVDSGQTGFAQASALTGSSDVSRVSLLEARTAAISRDSSREALADAADDKLVAQAEQQAEQHNAALAKLAKQAESQAAKIALNQWVLPVDGYHLTATFGQCSSLWSSCHTGLDFAAPNGTPIHAVANGTVTSVGYDGSYGNKTVITLDDGTELWFCHQTSYAVNTGDVVRAGQLIGYVGSTGNVTGPHLHLEVRPGGGDPVDPYQALVVHGLTP